MYTQHWKRCYVIRSFIFCKWPIIYLNSDFFIVMHLSLFHFPHFTFAKSYCVKILWVIVQASWVSCSPKLLYFYHQACIVPSQTLFQEHKKGKNNINGVIIMEHKKYECNFHNITFMLYFLYYSFTWCIVDRVLLTWTQYQPKCFSRIVTIYILICLTMRYILSTKRHLILVQNKTTCLIKNRILYLRF